MNQIPLNLPTAPRYQLEDWQMLRWQQGHRYYEAQLQQNLWGDWQLTRCWGHQGNKRGHRLERYFESYQQGQNLLSRTIKRRERDGYQTVSTAELK